MRLIIPMELGRFFRQQNRTRAHPLLASLLSCGILHCLCADADERRFTYTYEPEVMPQGGMEFEQWITLRTQRTSSGEVKQGNFNLWEIREELEYAVSDNYSVS